MHITGNALLLSDVHLSAEAPDITVRFLDFLNNHAGRAQHLFILGDLFELWIGDDAPVAPGEQVAAALKALADNGLPIYFMHGNRDFLLGDDYARQAGMRILDDPCTVHFNDLPILLSHGDAWCTDDVKYQEFRQHRSQPENIQAFLSQPVEQRMAFAKNARDASQTHMQDSAEAIMDVNNEAVLSAFEKHAVKHIIHGHTHRPADHDHGNNRRRQVLGDWYTQASWLEIDSDGIHRRGPII